MGKTKLVAFGAGEITPELIERSTLQKVQTGLHTLRNMHVTKFGGIKGRRGFVTLNNDVPTEAYPCAYYSIPEKGLLFMVTKKDVVVFENFNYESYSFDEPIVSPIQVGDYYTEAELQTLHFTSDEKALYIFCEGKTIVTVKLRPDFTTYPTAFLASFDPDTFVYGGAQLQYFATYPATPPSGYTIEYAFTHVKDEIESFIVQDIQSYTHVAALLKLPQAANEQNDITIVYNKTGAPPQFTADEVPDEIRMYRRPKDSGAWGFVASSEPVFGGTVAFTIKDFGQDADLTNQPPEYPTGFKQELGLIKPKTGLVYQNRLAITGSVKKNKVFASRTDAPDIMTRDFPLQDDSAVTLATGSDGGAKIGRFFDARGLLITTSSGIYETPSDILKPDTAYAIKRSNVIHDESIPVVGMGSATFVTDKRLSGVFKLVPAQDGIGLTTQEVSIFSAHLLEGRSIKSWCIQDNGTQFLWIVRDDGVLLSFSFQQDQELQSWARHDTKLGKFKSVNVINSETEGHILIAVVEKADGLESIQIMARATDDVREMICTDATVVYKNRMFTDDPYSLTMTNDYPLSDVFETGLINFDGPVPFFDNVDGLGAVGSVFRFFNWETEEYADYRVTNYVDANNVYVELYNTRDIFAVLDSTPASVIVVTEMYQTFTTLSSVYMGALNNKQVSIRCDGFTKATPLNPKYEVFTVTGGTLTLPEEARSAFISVGLPIVQDIVTLDRDRMEAYGDRELSQLVNKAWISYYKSRGFHIGSSLPSDDTVIGMEDHEVRRADDEDEVEGFIPPKPTSFKQEVTFDGDYETGESVSLRNVEPQPVGIRGIILDIETVE